MKIEASHRLQAKEEHQQLLDPVSDSLHHALECANKAKAVVGSHKPMLALVQAIKDAITELTIVQESET